MAVKVAYRPEHVGDWGIPAAAEGSRYETGTFALSDGTSIFYRSWTRDAAPAPVLLLMHGLGAHSGWFIDMGNSLNALGLTVYVTDHRGFGRSSGARGHATRQDQYTRDLEAVIDEIRSRHNGVPIFILGHSLGGVFALHLAARDAVGKRIKGVMLVNPGMAVVWKVPLPRQLRIALGGVRGSARQWGIAPGAEGMTANVEAAHMLAEDSYWQRTQSAAFIYRIGLRLRVAAMKCARQVRTPTLVIQTDADLSVDRAASRRCYDVLGCEDKTWKTYPGFAHDFEFEPERGQLDTDVAAWVLRHQ